MVTPTPTVSLSKGQGFGELFAWHGPGEQEALNAVAAEVAEETQLVAALHTFGDGSQAESATEVDQATDHRSALGVHSNSVDKGLVDLDHVHGEVTQVAERRIAGPEIVDSQAQA